MEPGKAARREFEYERHGVQALLAALLVHTGEVIGEVYARNTRIEFLDFLDQLEAQILAGKEVHAILDNLQVHKTPEVKQWLEDHPRWTFHFTPTHASWLNQIELFFSILTRRLLRRGIFTSKADLKTQLLAFIERYNPTAKPFAWTYQGKPSTHEPKQPDTELGCEHRGGVPHQYRLQRQRRRHRGDHRAIAADGG